MVNPYSIANYAVYTNKLRKENRNKYDTFMDFKFICSNSDVHKIEYFIGALKPDQEMIRAIVFHLLNSKGLRGKEQVQANARFLKVALMTLED